MPLGYVSQSKDGSVVHAFLLEYYTHLWLNYKAHQPSSNAQYSLSIVTINLFDLRWQYPNDMTDNLTFDTNKIPITIQSQIPPSPSARDPSAWPSLL